MPTSVESLGCGQWSIQAHVCVHVSWIVRVHLFFCQLRVYLVVIACPPPLLSSVACASFLLMPVY